MMKIAVPRFLPVTIGVMAMLMAMKTTSLVRAAVPHAESAEPSSSSPKPVHAASGPSNAPAGATVPPPTVQSSVAAVRAPPPAVAPPEPLPVSAAERALLVDLRQRRAELESKAQAIELREQVQAAAERRLGTRLDELTALQERLEQVEAARKDHDEANWRAMVKIYETMKPRDAAAIFNDLDKPVMLQIVDRMQERRASMVLSAMQPERAREVTAALAAMRTKAAAVPEFSASARSTSAEKQ